MKPPENITIDNKRKKKPSSECHATGCWHSELGAGMPNNRKTKQNNNILFKKLSENIL